MYILIHDVTNSIFYTLHYLKAVFHKLLTSPNNFWLSWFEPFSQQTRAPHLETITGYDQKGPIVVS